MHYCVMRVVDEAGFVLYRRQEVTQAVEFSLNLYCDQRIRLTECREMTYASRANTRTPAEEWYHEVQLAL
jgi:hypothetical protein